MNPEGYIQSGRVYLLTLPGDRNGRIELPPEFPNERSQDLVHSGNIGVQLSHEPQFDPAPGAEKLLISLPNERSNIRLIADKSGS